MGFGCNKVDIMLPGKMVVNFNPYRYFADENWERGCLSTTKSSLCPLTLCLVPMSITDVLPELSFSLLEFIQVQIELSSIDYCAMFGTLSMVHLHVCQLILVYIIIINLEVAAACKEEAMLCLLGLQKQSLSDRCRQALYTIVLIVIIPQLCLVRS